MQLRRLAVAGIVLGATLPAVPAATAAPRKPLPCKQVTDDEGDGRTLGLASPTLDVLSADISSGAKEVTATLRLKSAAVENDNVLAGGALWNFNVTAGGIKYTFFATWDGVTTIGPRELKGGLTAGSNPATPDATFKRVGNDFVWTVSRAAFPVLKKPKQFFFVTTATSGANSTGGDTGYAPPNTKYLDKTPTCLRSK